MREVDVIIVGGGPAGSSCARGLVARGLEVVVLDRAVFPRDKVCAGWVTPQLFATLALDATAYAHGRVLERITGFRVALLGEAPIDVDYGEVASYAIRRVELDDYLLRRSGAELRLGEPLTSLESGSDGWTINGELRAKVLVGAGGHFCPVARRLAPDLASSGHAIRAQELEYEAPLAAAPDVIGRRPELYFSPDLKGYGWLVRKGDYLNVGLGRDDPHGLEAHVRAFVDTMVQTQRLARPLPRKPKGHAYRLYMHSAHPLSGDRVLLVGDAAGLAYSESGEGIRPAVESGLLAAEAIVASWKRPDAAALSRYDRAISDRFGRHRGHAGVRAMIPEPLRHRVARALLRHEMPARRIVLDRWFLHRQQAALHCDAREVGIEAQAARP